MHIPSAGSDTAEIMGDAVIRSCTQTCSEPTAACCAALLANIVWQLLQALHDSHSCLKIC